MDIDRIQSIITSYHLVGAEYGDEDITIMFQKFKGPEEFAGYAQTLKSEGNSLFQVKKFWAACSCYRKAIKAICFVVSLDEEGKSLLRDLAISLNLNLAICTLKLHEFAQAQSLCSLVLSFDPRNVKALYRRALAYVNLGQVALAHTDLVAASTYEAHNKDVLKELDHVQSLLQLKRSDKTTGSKGKTVVGDSAFSRTVSSQVSGSNCVSSSTSGEVSGADDMQVDSASMSGSVPVSPRLEVSHSGEGEAVKPLPIRINSGLHSVPDSCSVAPTVSAVVEDFNLDGHPCAGSEPNGCPSVAVSKKHVFVNRREPSSSLCVSHLGLDQLKKGQDLLFYHPRSVSVMRVRAITSKQIQTEAPHDLESGEAEAFTTLPRERVVSLIPIVHDSDLDPHATLLPETTRSDASAPGKRQKVVISSPPSSLYSPPRKKYCRQLSIRLSAIHPHHSLGPKANCLQHQYNGVGHSERALSGTKRKALCQALYTGPWKKKKVVYCVFSSFNVFCLEGLEFHPGTASLCRTLPSLV